VEKLISHERKIAKSLAEGQSLMIKENIKAAAGYSAEAFLRNVSFSARGRNPLLIEKHYS
jgi:hypothetical protein